MNPEQFFSKIKKSYDRLNNDESWKRSLRLTSFELEKVNPNYYRLSWYLPDDIDITNHYILTSEGNIREFQECRYSCDSKERALSFVERIWWNNEMPRYIEGEEIFLIDYLVGLEILKIEPREYLTQFLLHKRPEVRKKASELLLRLDNKESK